MALVLRTRKPRCGYAPCASCGTFGYWYWREPEDEVAAQQRVGSVLVCSEECGMAWEAAQALLREPPPPWTEPRPYTPYVAEMLKIGRGRVR